LATATFGSAALAKPIVIYRLGSLGDTIVALPCFHKIAAVFPDSQRLVLTNFPISNQAASIESILKNGELIYGCIEYPLRMRSMNEIHRLWRKLKSINSDTIIYLGGDRGIIQNIRDFTFFRMCGFSKIIGLPLNRDDDAGRLDRRTGQVEWEAERLARCLKSLGPIDLDDPAQWDLRLTPPEIETAQAQLSSLDGAPFLAINTGGKLPTKDWGEANWAGLLDRLSGQLDLSLVFVGAEADRERAERLSEHWTKPTVNACGRLAPRETSALLHRAAAFVGHDSGPLHLAAAAGVPCVGLFGSGNPPGKWHPRGAGHRMIHDMGGVRHIAIEDVEAKVLDICPVVYRNA
jgi:heptosyltransferase-3